MSFSADLGRFAKATKSKLGEASRAIKISLFNGVIRDTRVRTGRLRGNWQTSVGQPIFAEIDRTQTGDNGSASEEVRQKVEAFSRDYLTNNLPYAAVWEERDGMIERNLLRINRNIQEAIRNIR